MAEDVASPLDAELPRIGSEAANVLAMYEVGRTQRDDAHNELVRLGYLDIQARKLLDSADASVRRHYASRGDLK